MRSVINGRNKLLYLARYVDVKLLSNHRQSVKDHERQVSRRQSEEKLLRDTIEISKHEAEKIQENRRKIEEVPFQNYPSSSDTSSLYFSSRGTFSKVYLMNDEEGNIPPQMILHHTISIQGLSKLTLIEEPKKRATSAARQRQAVPEAAVYSRSTAPSVCMTFIIIT